MGCPMPLTLDILTPVYNDGAALEQLLADLDDVGLRHGLSFRVTVIDDASRPAIRPDPERLAGLSRLAEVKVLRLAANAGHQRAIAIGLSHMARRGVDLLVVMDGDGEDRPEDIPRLLAEYDSGSCAAVVAARAKRSEGPAFRLGYWLFKAFYRLLTGRGITFGNFMLLDATALESLVHRTELWQSLPATLLRARIGHRKVPVTRGHRYCGASSMNITTLILHGLASISVFSDVALVRALVFTATLVLAAGAGIVTAVGVRLFTDLAIPGWATTVVLGLTVIGLQGALSTMSLVFLLLVMQRERLPVPRRSAEQLLEPAPPEAPTERGPSAMV